MEVCMEKQNSWLKFQKFYLVVALSLLCIMVIQTGITRYRLKNAEEAFQYFITLMLTYETVLDENNVKEIVNVEDEYFVVTEYGEILVIPLFSNFEQRYNELADQILFQLESKGKISDSTKAEIDSFVKDFGYLVEV